jgi:hypothetical protein
LVDAGQRLIPGMVPGAFVRVLFPTHEKPHRPGLLHIGYVVITAGPEAVIAYTTSQPWPSTMPMPMGARYFAAREAARLNQSRPFLMRLDQLAKLPMTRRWFPDLEQPGRGVIAIAPPALQTDLTLLAVELGRRHRELVEMRGPSA